MIEEMIKRGWRESSTVEAFLTAALITLGIYEYVDVSIHEIQYIDCLRSPTIKCSPLPGSLKGRGSTVPLHPFVS